MTKLYSEQKTKKGIPFFLLHSFFILLVTLLNCQKNEANNKNRNLGFIALIASQSTGYNWNLPPGFPIPNVPAENPMSEAKVELGRFLFYEKDLSQNRTQSCASCHHQNLAFTDGLPVGIGSTGEKHPRSSQHLSNAAYHARLTWSNPNMTTLEIQSRNPLFGINPIELGLEGNGYLDRLKSNSRYVELFAKAFGDGLDKISEQSIRFALASFQRTLISGNAPFDKYTYQNKKDSLSASAIRGMDIFNGEIAECFHCHGGFNFTDTTMHQGKTAEIFFHDNGNKSLTEYGALSDEKKGLFEVTGKTADIGKFRASSLKNIAVTYPFMHDGSIDCSPANRPSSPLIYSDACATEALGKVIDHYMSGGKTPSNKDVTLIRPFSLTPTEKNDLINFLKSLTDEEFLKNSNFSDPFRR